MRAERCGMCPNLLGDWCVRLKKPLSKIRGCSMSLAGKAFFKARHGDEKLRRDVIAPRIRLSKEELLRQIKSPPAVTEELLLPDGRMVKCTHQRKAKGETK